MKKKTVKKTKSPAKNTTPPPAYITVDGFVYERLNSDTVDVELDLDLKVLDTLDDLVKDGKYVSRGDAVRDILRTIIREKGLE